ncbi:GH25 family lysozyme, partial [Wolbachia pipientis]
MSKKGIDVSHWDVDIDWSEVANDGIQFAFAKATEGETFQTP